MIKYCIKSDGSLDFTAEVYRRAIDPALSEDDFITLHDQIALEWHTTQYQRERQYPSIGDQLDMIFHAGQGGDEFQTAIQAVKDAYPKPITPPE